MVYCIYMLLLSESVPIIDTSFECFDIKNAERTIVLHSQITKIITNKLVIVENTGKSPVCNFIFALVAGQIYYF